LHSGGFSDVRNFLLQHAVLVLQDDTGIPVSYFPPDKWQFRPFGRYTGPITMFAKNYQPKLTQLFQKGRTEALDFGLGYQWRVLGSNLLLASRNEVPTGVDSPVASTTPDSKPTDWSAQPGSDSAAGAKKSAARTGAKGQKSRASNNAPRPAPFYFPFFRF
jgi:hypothetical protein